MGGLKQQQCIVPQRWRQEAFKSSVDRATVLKTVGENLFRAFLLASGAASNAEPSSARSCRVPVSASATT